MADMCTSIHELGFLRPLALTREMVVNYAVQVRLFVRLLCGCISSAPSKKCIVILLQENTTYL